jgi:RNA polymerase sigma-70 factor (ECF subfamily)
MSLDGGDRQPISPAHASLVADPPGYTRADRWAGLLVASGRGEHASFELLARESRASLRFRALHIVSSGEEADEAVHDALLETWCTARAYDPLRGAASSWLGQLVGADHELVRSALSGLTDRQRQAIRLAYHEGLSSAESAARLGVPTTIMRTRLRDGIDRLRRLVSPVHAPDPGGVVPPTEHARLPASRVGLH